MRAEFTNAVKTYQSEFGIDLDNEKIDLLADFYELIRENNPVLHLIGPMNAEEFAIRHVLESLTLLEFLPKNAGLADVGAGAGLPSIPCLLVRDDLKAILIESKIKKAKFLENVAATLQISVRTKIVNRQFEEIDAGQVSVVTCRALDRFTVKLPRLVKWSQNRQMLFFGGDSLGEALQRAKRTFERRLTPLSERRYLYILNN